MGTNYKKAFTLAEILIVLTVMSVITLLTIPAIYANFQDAYFKSAYKRAYNIVSNILSMEISNNIYPYIGNNGSQEAYIRSMFDSLIANLSLKDYSIEGDGKNYAKLPDGTSVADCWINTDDGISYRVYGNSANVGQKKAQLNVYSTIDDLTNNSSYYIMVDTNGYTKGPICEEAKLASGLQEKEALNVLKCDRYPIYIGLDGVSAGHKTKTITGRIMEE